MPAKKQVALAQMKVGIFVTIALLLLATLILQQSWGVNWFKKSVKMVTYLPDVGGLKSGAPVWLAGIEIGRVRRVSIIPAETFKGNESVYQRLAEMEKEIAAIDRKRPAAEKMIDELQDNIRNLKTQIRMVEVQLDIRQQYLNRISRDSEVSISSRGLIGDSFIDISPGTYGGLPPKSGDYYVIESIQHPGFREIMTGANDVVANFGVLSEQFKSIYSKINPEKIGTGVSDTLGDLRSTVRKAGDAFSNTTQLVDSLHHGKGTFGKIVTDPELYQRMVHAFEKFDRIADSIQSGNGTIAKLINDPEFYNSANEMLKKAEVVMNRIEKGEGTLGKLSKDEALYENSKKALGQFAALMEEIEEGKGTMGKLLKDPGLYNNLDQSTAEISKLLYDLRQDPKKYLTIRFRVF
ncbi:MAG: MCE family protein [Acidobacteria bacterium]|nr:MCE family protein [Acidobacteriota bacterium]